MEEKFVVEKVRNFHKMGKPEEDIIFKKFDDKDEAEKYFESLSIGEGKTYWDKLRLGIMEGTTIKDWIRIKVV